MLPSSILLVVFAAVTVNAAPNENGVEFLFPTDGLTLNYMDTINVTYTSPFPKPLLYTFCTNKTNTKKLIEKERIDATPFNASHLFTLDYKDVATCYWNLRPNTSTGFGANSFPVKLLTEGRSQTTIGLSPTTMPTGSTSPDSTPSPSSNPLSSSLNGDTNNNGGGMSTGAKAGIGAGVGAVALLAILGVALFVIKKRKAKAALNGAGGEGKETYGSSSATQGYQGTEYQHGYSTPSQQNQEWYAPQGGAAGVVGEKWVGSNGPNGVNELPAHQGGGSPAVYEMGGESRIAEAPGSGVVGKR